MSEAHPTLDRGVFHELDDFEETGHLHSCIHPGCSCAATLYDVAEAWRGQVVALRAQQRAAISRAEAAEAAIERASQAFAAVGFRGQAAHLRLVLAGLESTDA